MGLQRLKQDRSTKHNTAHLCYTVGFHFVLIFIGVYLIYNVLLVSGVQQSKTAIHIHISTFKKYSFPILAIAEYWVELPVLSGKSE